MGNSTWVTEFILTGLTEDPHLQLILFVIFFAVYAITLMGNVGMIILIRTSPQLHTPMYFFLTSLSFLDTCYSTTVTPKLLSNFLKEKKSISFASCFTQLYFYGVFATTECYLLAMMAYDRYVAICNPLLYLIIMSQRKCIRLIAISYIAGIINASIHIIAMSKLSFCGPNIIKNFYCEGPPLLALSCSDVSLNDLLLFVFVGLNITITSLTVLTSYTYILITILKIRSATSRRKAFSTCTSHLIVITIFYGCSSFMYARPSSRKNYNLDQMASVFYVVVTPMLNPLIYSMRNQEVRGAFRNILGRKCHFQYF
ncbi:olfactory receptor 1052-like [Protobothrops mucrosquamatus]|uniref:olfactory receptor 1052-like n=1 Tax=Protobothrops mucrosquamatus TaxID=103944 RepID=UPI000775D29D|nr:olfactory receptor 1052-like [Protobothrops mucrosquamatus]